jgi:hypothetical protein
MRWKLSSNIKDRVDVVRIGKMAETWCRRNMGENNKKKFEIIVSYWQSCKGDTDMGEYDPQDHAIFIYYNNIDNVKELLQTIIHEWTHSLQPLTSKWKEYNNVVYSRNPFEREAYKSEALYSELWKSIKPKLNK